MLDYKGFEIVEAGESECSAVLKTQNLLILRDAQNAENGQIAPNWNVSGTRDFSLAKRNTESLRRVVSELLTRISSFASNDPFERHLAFAFGIESRTGPVRPRVSEVSTFFPSAVYPFSLSSYPSSSAILKVSPMQSLRLNPILNTDSYKLTHWWQYPPDTRHIYSYVESRGGMFDETMLAMLQYIIKSNFAGQVFTLDDVEEARRIAHAHFQGHPKSFNYEGFKSSTPNMAAVAAAHPRG